MSTLSTFKTTLTGADGSSERCVVNDDRFQGSLIGPSHGNDVSLFDACVGGVSIGVSISELL